MSDEEKFKAYLAVLNEENILYKKENAIQGLLDLYNKEKQELKQEKEKSHTILQEYKKMLDLEVEYLEEIDRLQKELEHKRNKKYKDKKEANRAWWNAHKDERNEKRRLQRKENKEQINAKIREKRAEDIDYRDKRRYYCFKYNHKNDDKRNYTFEEWKKYVENKAKKQIKEIPLLEELLKENKI